MDATFPPYSVCMSVYKNDNVDFVKIAIDSILSQTIPPSEIVLVIDGLIDADLQQLISVYQFAHNALLHVIPLKQNQGLGKALHIGVENTQYEYIARMDSDDIA